MEIKGRLEGYFETGTEGVYWAIYENGKTGYEGLHILRNGDHLVVYNDDDSVAFDGIINLDYTTNWYPYPWSQSAHESSSFCKGAAFPSAKINSDCSKGHSVEWAKERGLGQQAALNYWVHGIQKGFSPDVWGKMFFSPKSDTNPNCLGLKAIMTRNR